MQVFLTDPGGTLRGKWLPGDALDKVKRDGVAFPYSLFGCDVFGREVPQTGLHIESGDLDAVCRPVEGRMVPVPWVDRPTHQAMLTMHHKDGRPFLGDPRQVLARQVARLAERGMTATVALELEFYLLGKDAITGEPQPYGTAERGPERQDMYALTDMERHRPLLDAIQQACAVQDLPMSAMVSEASPGQMEVNLHHRDPLGAADDAVMLKRLISEVARTQGTPITFMAKPFADYPGNGMHIHVSLQDDDGPVFARHPERLHHAVQGTLSTMLESQLGFIGSYNGFRRMQPGSYAPASLTWGENNRSVAIRLPEAKPEARRLEHRLAGADANPYIVTALVLAAMLKGMDEGREPPAATTGNAYTDAGVHRLPARMDDAIERLAQSAFVAEALSPEFVAIYTSVKRAEWETFSGQISELEHRAYL